MEAGNHSAARNSTQHTVNRQKVCLTKLNVCICSHLLVQAGIFKSPGMAGTDDRTWLLRAVTTAVGSCLVSGDSLLARESCQRWNNFDSSPEKH